MFLTIDNLAARYHLLPSQVFRTADTLDLYVLDLGARWSNHRHQQASGPAHNQPAPVAQLTQEQMIELVAAHRNRD